MLSDCSLLHLADNDAINWLDRTAMSALAREINDRLLIGRSSKKHKTTVAHIPSACRRQGTSVVGSTDNGCGSAL